MASIYTQQLHNAQHAGIFSGVVYTVPASTLVVVTCIDAFFSASAAGQLVEVLLGAAVVIRKVSTGNEVDSIQWQGKQALNAGQTILCVGTGISSTFGITGYVLGP